MSALGDTDGDAATPSVESAASEGDANTTADNDATDAGIERDTLFHVLRNERRRRTLRYLLAGDEEPVTMRALAEAVAAAEHDTTVDALRSEERHRVYITLYQSHLPQMADAGIIEYDQDGGLIATTPRIEAFEAHIDYDDPEPAVPSWLWPLSSGLGLGIVAILALVQSLGALAPAALVALITLGVGTWRTRFDDVRPS